MFTNKIIATKEEQIKEAIKRMQKFKINKYIIEDFKNNQLRLSFSLDTNPHKISELFTRTLNADELIKIKELEDTFGIKIFTAIHSNTEFGDVTNYLYVSQYKDEWIFEEELFKGREKLVHVYCVNNTTPKFSEFGTIEVKKIGGILYRKDVIK